MMPFQLRQTNIVHAAGSSAVPQRPFTAAAISIVRSLITCRLSQISLGRAAGSSAIPQDVALFLAKAQAARAGIDNVLSRLSGLDTAVQQPVTTQAAEGEVPVQYAPQTASFVAVPSQTEAVLTAAQAKQASALQTPPANQVRCLVAVVQPPRAHLMC